MPKTGDNRRREARALTAALIQLVDEYNDTSTCVLEDLSPSGACVHSDLPLRTGMQVTLKTSNVSRTAVVKHCNPAVGGFQIGIEFVGDPWPEPIGLPIHWIPSDRE